MVQIVPGTQQDARPDSILLVEADPEVASQLTQVLRESNYQVTLASNGATAVTLARRDFFALVLADSILDGEIDAAQLSHLVKNNQPLLPVILFDSRLPEGARRLDADVDDYIVWPFSNGDLLARVRSMLGAYQTQRQLTRYSARLHTVNKIGQTITSILDLDLLLWKAIQLSLEAFDLSCFGVGLLQETEVFWEFGFKDESGAATKRSARTALTMPVPHASRLESDRGAIMIALREAARQLVATHLPHFPAHIITPITHGQRVIGVLFAGAKCFEQAASEDRLLFGALAEQLAVAIVNARLVMAERSESYVAETLLQVTHLFNGLRDVSQICQTAVSALLQVSGVQRSLVGFWADAADEAELTALHADSEETRELFLRLPPSHQTELLTMLDRMGDSFVLQPTRQKTSNLNDLLSLVDTSEILVAPVLREGQERSMLLLFARPWHRFGTHDRALVAGITYQLAKSIELARSFTSLEEERTKLAAVLLNMQTGAFIIDAGGHIAYCNPQLAQIVRGDVHDLVNSHYQLLFEQIAIHSANPVKARRDFEAALQQLADLPTVEVALTSAPPANIEFYFFPIEMRPAGSYGWGCLVRDVTGERERLTATSNLLSNISHELRSPLAAIKGFVSMLVDFPPYGAEERRQVFLQSISQSTTQLGRLIDHMLEILRLDAGIVRLERRLLALEPIVQRTVQPLRLTQKDYEYEVSLSASLPQIEIDPAQIEQVLRNLLDNAIKRSPPGGKISVQAAQQESEVMLRITDRGTEITPDVLARIFERTYQISQLSLGQSFETGLGLYLCREILVAHGGRIWAESDAAGATFCVALPVNPVLGKTPASGQSLAQTAPAEQALWTTITGLIVEDDAPMVRLLELSLQSEGYKVVTARRGEAALELASTQRFNFVLLDVQLPDLDGFQICHRLREFSNVPIIIITGHADERDRVRGLNMGADDYLIKPISQTELIARVRAVLRRTGVMSPVVPQLIAHFGDLTLDFARRQVLLRGQPVTLSPREYHLLQYLASKPGHVFTHNQLLTEVWGSEYRDATQYLWVHISRLRHKLEDDKDNPRYVFTESGVGYRFCEA